MSHTFHDPFELWSPIASYICHFPLLPPAYYLTYNFSFTSIPYFLHISQWIFVPNQSCCLLYSFCVNLLRLLTALFTPSLVFPHILNGLLIWVLSIFAFTLLILMACCSVAIIKASVVLFMQLFVSHPYKSSLALPIFCLINCNFWFDSVIAFHYFPIFFLSPLFLNALYRLFITFTRLAWRD